MQYRTDPKSENSLSVLGFGCMRFPRGINVKIDRDKTEAMLLSAIENGVNYFDTAYVYAGSEEIVGDILYKNAVRDKIYLATKLPHTQCKSYEDFDRFFAIQQQRLHTDWFDYYLIHNLSSTTGWERLVELGIERWIEEKKASGQIRQIGFSFHGSQDTFLSLLDLYDWDFCQIQYNYLNENYQAGRKGLVRAHEKGMPVIVMEPLLGGKLASGLPKKAVKLFQGGGSPAEWGLRWLWDQPEVTVVLSGMSSDEQLADNLQAAEKASVPLSEQEKKTIASVISIVNESFKIPCTGCNYCMPCPQGINIPGCFASYNASSAMGFITGISQYMNNIGALDPEKNLSPRKCVNCGACKEKCPQHIDIPKELERVARKFEPFWIRGIMKIVISFMRG